MTLLVVRAAILVLLLPAVVQDCRDGEWWIAIGRLILLLCLGWDAWRDAQAFFRNRRSGREWNSTEGQATI